jgi:hypothetical protein
VAKPPGVGACDVRARVQRMHLMHANVDEPVLCGLERVDQADRLAVGHRDDDVGARLDVLEDRRRGPRRSGARGCGHRATSWP